MGKRRGRPPGRRGASGTGAGKRRRKEAEEDEDLCFVCKDGGDLRFCDYGNCHKAYHHYCVGKDDDFLNSDEQFICNWHTCFICKGHSYYRCFCCPDHSVCRGCARQAEFFPVMRQTKGFCHNCLRMTNMIEKNVDVDSDGERVDFSDRETYEFLFKDYWKIVKDKEGLTLDNVQKAYDILKRGLNCNELSDSEKPANEEHSSDDDFLGSSDDDDDDNDDEPIHPSVRGTPNKVKILIKEGKSKKNVYVGWGSKELIEFLSSIGKDTSKPLDQFGAAEVVKEYAQQKDLVQKDKKKHVICDDRLRSVFRKSKLNYNKIYSLLERHIAENTASEDEMLVTAEDTIDSVMKRTSRTMNSESSTPEGASERYRSCFASLVRDNIKLIYLKRSLVMDLLKQPEMFECKVIGCFVRVKNNRKDYICRNSTKDYQLGQVTGIKKSSEAYKIRDTFTDILLCVSNMWSEVKISLLSDEEFGEDECEDLRLLAQKEPSKRQTVAELEEKARSVHGDIVNHWINKELQKLDRDIEYANEKGWRHEMHALIDKRKLLRTQSERQRLLEEVPRVIPDTEDSKDSELLVTAANKSSLKNKGTKEERAVSLKNCSEENSKGANEERVFCLKSCSEEKSEGGQGIYSCKFPTERTPGGSKCDGDAVAILGLFAPDTIASFKTNAPGDTPTAHAQNQGTEATKPQAAGDSIPGTNVQMQGTEVIRVDHDDDEDGSINGKGGYMTVIDLDSDEPGDHDKTQLKLKYVSASGQKAVKAQDEISECTSIWYYIDPHGDEQGPVSMKKLRVWKKSGYFVDDFKVWRAGQSSESAILLTDALMLTSAT